MPFGRNLMLDITKHLMATEGDRRAKQELDRVRELFARPFVADPDDMDAEAACKHIKESLLGNVKSGILALVAVASTQFSRISLESEFGNLMGLLRQGNALVKASYGRWVTWCLQKFVAPCLLARQ